MNAIVRLIAEMPRRRFTRAGVGLAIVLAAVVPASAGLAQTAIQTPPSVVYFGSSEAALTNQARETLAEVARTYRAVGDSTITLSGHTATFGDARTNVTLAERRAEAVKSYLVSLGVPGTIMVAVSYGEARPVIDTPDNTRQPENDRVEVLFGPASGW